LQEISENIEELYGTSSYIPLVENLIRVFIKILHETTPQFIAENNTLQLRKLILELLYRLSSSEIMKSYSKNLQQILLRLIHIVRI
jgi:transformation/transcription domain-associated protein